MSTVFKRQRIPKNIIYLISFISLIILSICEQDNISDESDTVICGGFLKFSEELPFLKKKYRLFQNSSPVF